MEKQNLLAVKTLQILDRLLLGLIRHKRDFFPLQFVQGPPENLGEAGVQVDREPFHGEHGDGVRNKVQEGPEAPLRLAQSLFSKPTLRNVLEGFNGSHDPTGFVNQGSRGEEKPLPFFSEVRKKKFRLVSPFHKSGLPAPSTEMLQDFFLGN